MPGAADAGLRIAHLCDVPQHRGSVARLIHDEFWRAVPGASVEGMAARLAAATTAEAVPLCLVALRDDSVVGAVNLVDSDDDDQPHWTPWLAGMVVAAPCRGQGIGTALVLALLQQARRLGVPRVYFGTDGPGFYTRLGAQVVAQPRADFWFMAFTLGSDL
jgi:predicted N-acetyltransferase YhbS